MPALPPPLTGMRTGLLSEPKSPNPLRKECTFFAQLSPRAYEALCKYKLICLKVQINNTYFFI